jgi:MFS superfamily sulfate permease-like transporter
MPVPVLGGLLPFRPREVGKDALAGLTLASMNIPQVLGYTRIAGTPVVTGLYTVLLPLIGFALFGSSRHLVVAADSATAAIFSSALSRMAPIGGEKYMALVGMLTLLTAGLLLLARIFKLGFLADFLSRTALVGFLTGVGVQVGVAMLGDMLGVAAPSHRTLDQIAEVAIGRPKFDALTLGLSVFVAAAILLGRFIAPLRRASEGPVLAPAHVRPAERRQAPGHRTDHSDAVVGEMEPGARGDHPDDDDERHGKPRGELAPTSSAREPTPGSLKRFRPN